MDSPVLVTGAAGFIGFHVASALLAQGHKVVGIDNLSPYYCVELKQARLSQLAPYASFTFEQLDITDEPSVVNLWSRYRFKKVVHLAAQPGVRYSFSFPLPYIETNIKGTLHILEGCRHQPDFQKLVYASSSSVYGLNTTLPFSEDHPVDTPVSLYAASKKSCELIAQSYYHLYRFPVIGLRFFTVYGPWGRPDMAVFLFTKAILEKKPIDVYNHGQMRRDFTYIDDIVSGILSALSYRFSPQVQHPIYNLGNHKSEPLNKLIMLLEDYLGTKAHKNLKDLQPGEVLETYADISKAQKELGFFPTISLEEGLKRFVEWYRKFYRL